MIKSIYEVDELLKESAWNDRILILKEWADSIIVKAADIASSNRDRACDLEKEVLKIKEQIR